MASIGSLTMETPVLLHSGNHGRPRLPFFAFRLRSSICYAGLSESTFGCAINGCRVTRPQRIKGLRATSEASGEDEERDEPEDAFQATIEKSKKVLAMQRDVLQQVGAMTWIQHGMGDVEYNQLHVASIGDESTNRPNGCVFDVERYVPLTVDDARENEDEKVLSHEIRSLDVDSHKRMRDTTSERVWSDELPSFLSSSSASSSPKDEQHEDVKESSLQEVNGEANMPTSEDVKPPPLAGANVMNVILVSAECAPWSKTGGLGDVAGALPKALARRGHRVMVVAPRYDNYGEPQDSGVRKMYKVDGQDMEVVYFQTYIDGVDFVFIESPKFRHIENDIYGGNRMDILKRMVLFCKAAVEGRGPVDDFSYLDLPPHYLDLFKLYDPVGGEHLNIFAAGLKTADRVVTVSHGYAWELKTSEGGWGLHGIINDNDWKLMGIVNGIDTIEWNPQLDVHLKSDGYTNYSLETLQTGKAQCKEALQRELGLPVRGNVPLIGFIGRLDNQKGIDIIVEAIPWMMGQDVQLIMLGTGRADLEQMLRHIASQHHNKIRGWVGFSVKMAHRITAGADILLMPSRFEPCGLNQLYAMSYGTIPVVHAVGGLRDTVQPFDPYNESGLGWTFDRAETGKLTHALENCLLTYREYKNSWEGIQRRGMMQDLSWDNAAQKYEEVLVAAKYQW
ncbi:hypothetical protein HYC85_005774 [Camellia sinensis]|uniref:Starch synthase catalytic domain-containing protein n=1 Tax=Camellia sinensis TaxID=4442 RepID=A0A7J7I0U3_CAMSI|nr:hypothetical protein HYC85_005774 [Camellia sinensis]